MLAKIRTAVRTKRKAIVAAVVGFAATVAAKYGVNLTPAQLAAVGTVVSALLVFLVPNAQEG